MSRSRKPGKPRPYEGDVVSAFEDAFGYRFGTEALLLEALTHPSFAEEADEPTPDNQRLEFVGDAVVGLTVARTLFERYPGADEGRMSKLRGALVSSGTLAAAGREHGLGEWLRLGRGEERTNGREKRRLLVDVVEALAGAIFLDGGLEPASRWVAHLLRGRLNDLDAGAVRADHKSLLQERIQGESGARPRYRLIDVRGPEHAQTFVCSVEVPGLDATFGEGRSKKAAEQAAAESALRALTPGDGATIEGEPIRRDAREPSAPAPSSDDE